MDNNYSLRRRIEFRALLRSLRKNMNHKIIKSYLEMSRALSKEELQISSIQFIYFLKLVSLMPLLVRLFIISYGCFASFDMISWFGYPYTKRGYYCIAASFVRGGLLKLVCSILSWQFSDSIYRIYFSSFSRSFASPKDKLNNVLTIFE